MDSQLQRAGNTHKTVAEWTQISGQQLAVAADTQAAIVAVTQEAVVQANCSQLAWLAGHYS